MEDHTESSLPHQTVSPCLRRRTRSCVPWTSLLTSQCFLSSCAKLYLTSHQKTMHWWPEASPGKCIEPRPSLVPPPQDWKPKSALALPTHSLLGLAAWLEFLNKNLHSTIPASGTILSVLYTLTHLILVITLYILFLPPFCKCGNGGIEKISGLPGVTQPASSGRQVAHLPRLLNHGLG